ncbi:MAG: hypothetical protein ACI90V_010471, partial [Bacillariaceae sp.]
VSTKRIYSLQERCSSIGDYRISLFFIYLKKIEKP